MVSYEHGRVRLITLATLKILLACNILNMSCPLNEFGFKAVLCVWALKKSRAAKDKGGIKSSYLHVTCRGMWRDLPASDRTLLEKKTREEVSRVPVESIRHFNAGTQPLISGSFAPSPVDDKAGLHRAQTTFSEGISRSNLPMESSIAGAV